MKVASKKDQLHFSDLQYICVGIYVSYAYATLN